MNKPVFAITGANGFIGSALVQYLENAGYPVITLTRKKYGRKNGQERFYDLQQPPAADLLTGVDILIHCAVIWAASQVDAVQLNYTGTEKLIHCARSNGVKKIIFISSVSAHEEAISSYGKGKLRTESLFDLQKDVVLRCSLVIGPGGLFGRMLHHALSKRIIPLFYKGRQRVQVISIDDIQQSILTIIRENMAGCYILANRQHITYRSIFQTIARVYKKRIIFIPVPVSIVQLFIHITSRLKIPFPINKENIQGLKTVQFMDPEASLRQLQLNPASLEEKLQSMASQSNWLLTF
jgi:nucleoside-diphosphate-sugar epimerase